MVIFGASFRSWSKLLVPLALVSILAACGGPSKTQQASETLIGGRGYTFSIPTGWTVSRTAVTTSASSGKSLVSVSVFRLRRAYSTALFDLAASSLDRVANSLGHVTTRHTTLVAGRKSRVYDVDTVKNHLHVGFVLDGKREFQLLCEAPLGVSFPDRACELLFASFAPS